METNFLSDDFYRLLGERCTSQQLYEFKVIIEQLSIRADTLFRGEQDQRHSLVYVRDTVLELYALCSQVFQNIEEKSNVFSFLCNQLGVHVEIRLSPERYESLPNQGSPVAKTVNFTVQRIQQIIGRKQSP